ncbi:NmrA family NAD(P)-binding protein [Piscinibacter sp.]|uniref:NmrA family NAD(P)-binding protein n=1 Tax=Piscinibacter sp. TaxID=1903157 RepID=UPI002F42EAF4
MTDSSGTVLVTGATGAQGGATTRRLLAAGRRVRFLTRDPHTAAARTLIAAGAQAAQGDLGDAASVAAAMHGVEAVFSVQVPDITGNDCERRHGFALVQAARAAGVLRFVHTSVAQAGQHTGFPGWDSGRWLNKYWTDKRDIEEAVRHAGFARWTVLQPAFMMDNLALPKSGFMFARLAQGELLTALQPDTRLHFIAADDVGSFAAAALTEPARLHGQTIPLATEALTMTDVAATLARVLQANVRAVHVTPQEALAAGLFTGWVNTQEWMNEVGYAVDIAKARSYEIALTPLDAWAAAHSDSIRVPVARATA